MISRLGEYGIYPRAESPDFPFHPLARRTGVALVELDGDGVARTGIVPCVIGGEDVPRPVRRTDPGWEEAVAFLRACVDKVGLDTRVSDDSGWNSAGSDVVEVHPGRDLGSSASETGPRR